MNTPAAFERVACEAASSAGRMIRERFGEKSPIIVEQKGLHDFVTAVDRDAEALVIGHLRKHYPEHTVMAEEGSPEAPSSDYRWIVDPLDGTTNFIHGVPVFGVSVALEDREGLVAGAIHDPLRDETFHAHRSGGARLNGRPIHCSEPRDIQESLIAPIGGHAQGGGGGFEETPQLDLGHRQTIGNDLACQGLEHVARRVQGDGDDAASHQQDHEQQIAQQALANTR